MNTNKDNKQTDKKAQQAVKIAKALADVCDVTAKQARQYMSLLKLFGDGRKRLNDIKTEIEALEQLTQQCSGTPSWDRRKNAAGEMTNVGLRLVHPVDVNECSYCGEKGDRVRLRPYVPQAQHGEALQAVADHQKHVALTAKREALQRLLYEVDTFVSEKVKEFKGLTTEE